MWIGSWHDALTIRADVMAAWSVFVAEAGGQPVGFVAIRPLDSRWEVEHLWVRREYQRRGLGRALMARAIAHARERGGSALRIESDPYAESFYRSLGAERVGDVPAPMPGAPDRMLPLLVLDLSTDDAEHSVRRDPP